MIKHFSPSEGSPGRAFGEHTVRADKSPEKAAAALARMRDPDEVRDYALRWAGTGRVGRPRPALGRGLSWATSGNHTLEVRVLGAKNAASTGKRVDVDAFVALR